MTSTRQIPRSTASSSRNLRIKTVISSTSSTQGLWSIKEISGKGLGLIALRRMMPGTLIISEAPLITTTSITSLSPTRTEFELSEALATLPVDQQEAYYSLHNNHAETDPAHPLAGIVRSNVYPLGANARVGGIFLNISRINHSCAPNAVQYWNDLLGRETVYSVKPIDIGEEITLSYYLGGSSVARRQVLLEQFGFWCRCDLCSLPADELAMSDRRLERAQELDRLIGDPERCANDPDIVMAACREMFEIFEQELVRDGRLARLFYDAFQLCNMHSDLARSQCFAEFYYEAKLTSEGAGSHNVLEMLAVRQKPQSHNSFGITNRWKSSVKDRPECANIDEFRMWLWKY